ncbi:hypothetical protein GCM10010327_62210 [Streptomyces nitrosporeus]|nr:hypothetical protein GCM10010327_62210 [Streptomyces nitrosporeus]
MCATERRNPKAAEAEGNIGHASKHATQIRDYAGGAGDDGHADVPGRPQRGHGRGGSHPRSAAGLGLPERVWGSVRPMVTRSGKPYVHLGIVRAEVAERIAEAIRAGLPPELS